MSKYFNFCPQTGRKLTLQPPTPIDQTLCRLKLELLSTQAMIPDEKLEEIVKTLRLLFKQTGNGSKFFRFSIGDML